MPKILIIEPFYGGSHKQLLDTILKQFHESEFDLFTLPAKKWHWRARTSALYFSDTIPTDQEYSVLFTTSVLNLAELIGARLDLAKCRKIIYFHENQLIYPIQEVKERDVQFGLNEIISCLAADEIVFNSMFNMNSFLNNINSFLNISPDLKLRNIKDKIAEKCGVLYFPIALHQMPHRTVDSNENGKKILHLVWPHRWEHDKFPQLLTSVLEELDKRQVEFRVSILGESTQTIPECFEGLRLKLGPKLVNFGYMKSRDEYLKTLLKADVVISTAGHEFYGVAMLEAVFCGCLPVAPNKLVYPEFYPKENLYNTSNQLIKMLYNWCRNRALFEMERENFFLKFDFEKHTSKALVPRFISKLKGQM